ncbi:MAG: sigma-54-dependent Fis family transcriptional regulator [Verrucomicrobia bacterium]|nr:sigma-54-dependent Fis family transcriptional regulator [Verrucomicrobiota bacterium]
MSRPYHLLVVEDVASEREILSEHLTVAGYHVSTARDGQEALEKFQNERIDLVISDLRLPDISGVEIMRAVKDIDPRVPVIIVTAYGSIEGAVEAMRRDAYSYVTKPLDVDQLKMDIARALQNRILAEEVQQLREQLRTRYRFEGIVGTSKQMQEVLSQVARVAPTRATVLITGETGTGKELVARAIHFNSPRAEKPFVAVACGAIPQTLMESELFGHERGAFTGADRLRVGRFEQSDGGTILLDEIHTLPLAAQAKLLRVLQERTFERVGSSQPMTVDIRVLAATNQNLEEAVAHGEFRRDLFYRLNVIQIRLPSLWERKEDGSYLIEHFIRKFADQNKKGVTGVTEEAMRLLVRYAWPGNVRELENAIEHSVVLARGDAVTPDDLPLHIRQSTIAADQFQVGMTLAELERVAILETLKLHGGNKTKTAAALAIGLRTLHSKLKEYGQSNTDEHPVVPPAAGGTA